MPLPTPYELLENLVAGIGDYLCSQCKRGSHVNCAGHNNMDDCACRSHGHDYKAAYEDAVFQGIQRLRVMQKV